VKPEVLAVTDADIQWPFRTGVPTFRLPNSLSVELDPCPAYGHDLALIRKGIGHAARLYPLPYPLTVYVATLEDMSRTNAFATQGHDYTSPQREDGSYEPIGYIFMSGKRIPPHPAMGRYLSAHEYGHHVQYAMAGEDREFPFLAEYAAMRGLDTSNSRYGGGHWHHSTGEVFANDFRLVVAEVETEFWPHAGIPRPGSRVRSWWRARMREVS
jgi:hypothetical protein